MALVTVQQLTDAARDADDLSSVVNGAASPGTLTSRLGRSLKTVAKVIADIDAALTSAITAFTAALPKMKGTWSSSTAYSVGDLVSYGGSSYYAIQAGTNHVPTDTAYWALSAQTGDTSQARTQPGAWNAVQAFVAGLTTNASVNPWAAGDIVSSRASAPTTGVVFLGNSINEYVSFDGARYLFGNTGKPVQVGTPAGASDAATKGYVDSRILVVARFNVGGTLVAQTGAITLGNAVRSSAGAYSVAVPGMTASGIVQVSVNNGGGFVGASAVANPSAGAVSVFTGTDPYPAGLTDLDFTLIVYKL